MVTACPARSGSPRRGSTTRENLLRRRDDEPAMIFRGENKVRRTLTFADVHDTVSRLAQALRAQGVKPGDRVAAIVSNMPEAIIGLLATSSIGAIWSSCSPDFGVQGVLDRFGQIEPTVLLSVDGYWYGGKRIDVLGKLGEIVKQLPSVKRVAVIPYLDETPDVSGVDRAVTLPDFLRDFARPTSRSSSCRSTTRSTSSIRPARPACRSASSTARADRCSST
jgi:acetoacetyl-CoA synthetase